MNNINTLTDDIYEALIDQDYHSMNIAIKELTSNLKELQKLSEHDLNLIKKSDQECKDQLDLLRNQRVDNAISKTLKQRYFKQPEELDVKEKVRLN